jgi:hypothetical protein
VHTIAHACTDPSPFHALTLSAQEKYASSAKPPLIQTSPLSDLQILVKESKKAIIDPILERCAAYTAQLSLEDEDEEENVDDSRGGSSNGGDKQHKEYWTIEIERERERDKIRELKKRKLHAGLSLPGMGAAGVFVRNDIEDESAVVDVTMADDWHEEAEKEEAGIPAHTLVDGENMQYIDRDLAPNGRQPLIETDGAQTKSRPARTRKVTVKHQQWQEENPPSSKKRKRRADFSSMPTIAPAPTPASAPRSAKPAQTDTSVQNPGSPMNVDEDEDDSENENEDDAKNGHLVPTTNGKSARGRGAVSKNPPKPKPKSETYKQAWSESEQNLLDQLLEKIPDGEKNRCVFGPCAILLLPCTNVGTIGGKRSREL